MSSTEISRIAGELRRMYKGPAWHGPCLTDALEGVTATQASARPISAAHSIFELTHHIAAWIGEVESRLRGNPSGNPKEGDWPPRRSVDDAGWQAARDHLAQRQTSLMELLKILDPARLDTPVDPEAPSPIQRKVTTYILLHGLVQHTAYHIGQIVILRKGM